MLDCHTPPRSHITSAPAASDPASETVQIETSHGRGDKPITGPSGEGNHGIYSWRSCIDFALVRDTVAELPQSTGPAGKSTCMFHP